MLNIRELLSVERVNFVVYKDGSVSDDCGTKSHRVGST